MVTNFIRRSEINFWNTYDYLVHRTMLKPFFTLLFQFILVKKYRVAGIAVGGSALAGLLSGYLLFLLMR